MRPGRATSANVMRARRIARLLCLAVLLPSLISCAAPEKQLERAHDMRHTGRHAEALTEYEQLIAIKLPADPKLLSRAFVGYGQTLWAVERREEAVAALQKAVAVDAANLDAHLRLAEALYGIGALGPAIQHAELTLKLDAGNLDALTLLGQAFADAGQLLPARAALEQVRAEAPGRSVAAITLARIYAAWRQPEHARDVLQKAAAASPSAAEVLLALGMLEEQEGNEPQAEVAYRRAVAVDGKRENRLRLAQFLQRSSRLAEAEEELARIEQLPEAQPALADFELGRGRAAQALGRYLAKAGPQNIGPRVVEAALAAATASLHPQERETWLRRARRLLDEHRAALDAATIAVLEAELALARADTQTARLHAATAAHLAPASAAAHYILGVTQQRSGQQGAALASWREAVARDAEYVPAHIMLATSLLAQEPAGAATHAAVAVRAEPGNLDALVVYARALWAQGRRPAARSIAGRAVALNPRSPVPYLLAGEFALAEGHFADALIKYRQAVLVGPHSREAIEGLARVYRAGDISKPMLRKMEVLAANDPPSPTLMEIVGRLYAERGWAADAERCLRRALALEPHRESAAFALTSFYARTGRPDAVHAVRGLGSADSLLLEGAEAQRAGRIEAAIERYEAAVRAGERSGIAANNLAWLYVERGERLDRALYLARSARDLAPGNPAILDTLGVVLLRRGEFSDAVAVLEEAAQLTEHNTQHRRLREQVMAHLEEAQRRSGVTASPGFPSSAAPSSPTAQR